MVGESNNKSRMSNNLTLYKLQTQIITFYFALTYVVIIGLENRYCVFSEIQTYILSLKESNLLIFTRLTLYRYYLFFSYTK